jgi:hypothetical protein
MTEKQFQETRKVMQTANAARGWITVQKNNVSRLTALEDKMVLTMQPGRAEGARKALLKAIDMLAYARKKFADIKLPTE